MIRRQVNYMVVAVAGTDRFHTLWPYRRRKRSKQTELDA